MHTDCELLDAELDRQPGPAPSLSENLARHLRECPRCRSLHAWMAADLATPQVPAALNEQIVRTLAGSLRPVKPFPPVAVSVLQIVVFSVVFVAALVALAGPAGFARMSSVQIIAMTAIFAGSLGLLSVSLGWQVRPGSYQRFPAAAGIAGFGLALLAAMALLFPWRTTAAQAFVAEGWPCLAAGTASAAVAAIALWFIAGRAVLSMKMGVTLGAASGLLGVAVLEFKCPHLESPHQLAWHGSVVLISIAAGAITGSLPRRRPVLSASLR